MRTEKFYEPHKLGLERLTGDNTGLIYANERKESEINPETGVSREVFVYDVYEVSDARFPHKAKSEAIKNRHPYDDEIKIMRQTIAKMLKDAKKYDCEKYAEFKAYNEFAESI